MLPLATPVTFAPLRRLLFLLAGALAALTFAPSALAWYSVTLQPVLARNGYYMSAVVYKSDATATTPSRVSVTISLTRTTPATATGPTTQSHTWAFRNLAPTVLQVSSDLRVARISTGTAMGRFGFLNLSLRNPGVLTTTSCGPSGRILTRPGTEAGTARLVTGTTYFGTITKTAFPAKVATQTGTCPPPACVHATTLSASRTHPSGMALSFTASRSDAETWFTFAGAEPLASTVPAQVSHVIREKVATAAFANTPDFKSASARAGTTGQLVGNLAFTAPSATTIPPSAPCNFTTTVANGSITGGLLTAHFHVVGDRSIVVGSRASLTNY